MSLKLVQQVKADLEAQGKNLSGPCGAFSIVRRVAWQLRDSGAGLLDKPQGNNCEGFATDVLCYPNGKIRDILIDGGGANTPQWPDGDLEVVDASRYRNAIDPGDPPKLPPMPEEPPDPKPVPEPEPIDLTPILNELAALTKRVTDLEHAPPPKMELPDLIVEGDTSRTWGHGHRINLAVRKK